MEYKQVEVSVPAYVQVTSERLDELNSVFEKHPEIIETDYAFRQQIDARAGVLTPVPKDGITWHRAINFQKAGDIVVLFPNFTTNGLEQSIAIIKKPNVPDKKVESLITKMIAEISKQ